MDKKEALSMLLCDLVESNSLVERQELAAKLMFGIPLILGVSMKFEVDNLRQKGKND